MKELVASKRNVLGPDTSPRPRGRSAHPMRELVAAVVGACLGVWLGGHEGFGLHLALAVGAVAWGSDHAALRRQIGRLEDVRVRLDRLDPHLEALAAELGAVTLERDVLRREVQRRRQDLETRKNCPSRPGLTE